MRTVQVVILAGGLGTRMSHWTTSMPKALIPVAGEPFLYHQLRLLESSGLTDVILSTGYLSDAIDEALAVSPSRNLKISCIHDGPTALGTAGAIRRIIDLGLVDDTFLALYGDSYLLVDYLSIAAQYDPSTADSLMTVMRNDQHLDASNARYEQGRVKMYRKGVSYPEGQGMHHIDYGLSVLSSSAIIDFVPLGQTTDLADFFTWCADRGRLQGSEVEQRFYEIGSEVGRADLEEHLHFMSEHS